MAKKQEQRIDEKQTDEWLKKGHDPEDVKTLLQGITKAVLERALQGEMTEHLGYAKNDIAEKNTDNARNGSSAKSLKGEFGEIELETPRDRKGEFEPRLIKKHQTRFTGFDEKVLSLYARGMTTREIQGHLEEMYGWK
jgi:transposase-like protein